MKNSVSEAISSRRLRILIATVMVASVLVPILVLKVRVAVADAGDPINGTIQGTVTLVNPADPLNSPYRVTISGAWDWKSHTHDCNQDRAGIGYAIAWGDGDGNAISVTAHHVTTTVLVGSTAANPMSQYNLPDNVVHPTPGAFFHDISSPVEWQSWRSGCGIFNGSYPVGTFGPISHVFANTVQSFDICIVMYDVHGGDAALNKPPKDDDQVTAGGAHHNNDNTVQTNKNIGGGGGSHEVFLVD